MQTRWWQSIRGRLGLGSALMALLTTTMLALTAMEVIDYYYGVYQRDDLAQLATEKALYIDKYFAQNPTQNPKSNAIFNVVQMVLRASPNDDQQYWMIVFNSSQVPIYPSFPNNKMPALPSSQPLPKLTTTAPAHKVSSAEAGATGVAIEICRGDVGGEGCLARHRKDPLRAQRSETVQSRLQFQALHSCPRDGTVGARLLQGAAGRHQ